MKAVLKYPGSKWSTAEWIISYFPAGYEKMTYLEPFCGGNALDELRTRIKANGTSDISKPNS